MKMKKINYFAVSMFVSLLLCISWTIIGFTQTKTESANLSFKGKTNKEIFTLGEPISVAFEFSNNGKTSLAVHRLGVENGILKILVANNDNEFKRFWGYGWGQHLGKMLSLAPGESHKYKDATILYQGKIETEGLSEKAARAKLDGNITTEYAFPEPGIYFIKGISVYANKVPSFGDDSSPIEVKTIESEPIKINVNEPNGKDSEVWRQIKGNSEIALLMQSGTFNTNNEVEKERLINQVEQIIERYPNSTYSGYLRANLEKFKTNEARRNEFYKNVKERQKPEN